MNDNDHIATHDDMREFGRRDADVLIAAMLPGIDVAKGGVSDDWAAAAASFFGEQLRHTLKDFEAAGVTLDERTAYAEALKAHFDTQLAASFAPYLGGR